MIGLPATTANNLSKPMRRLSPAATMMAVSIVKTVKRVTRLQGSAASRSFVLTCNSCNFLTAQLLLRFRCRADFDDGFPHNSCHLACAHSLRQIPVQDRQLFFFLVSEVGAAAFLEALDGMLALLCLLANHLRGVGVA